MSANKLKNSVEWEWCFLSMYLQPLISQHQARETLQKGRFHESLEITYTTHILRDCQGASGKSRL